MAGPYKTRCPHCGAQFKISDQHLGQARGAVRCGSCLRIFQATDHLLDTTHRGDSPPSDRWDGALDDDAPRLSPDSGHGDGLQLSDSFLDLDDERRDDGDRFSDLDSALDGNELGGHDGADESWAEALLRDLDDDEAAAAKPTAPEPDRPIKVAPATRETPRDASTHADDDHDAFDFLNRNMRHAQTASERPDYLAPPPSGPAVAIKWGLLSLLALAILTGQYAVFHFQELARQPQWRPYFAQACERLGCQLPLRSDPSQLRGANLVVRSHPEFLNALMVDVLLFNDADWPQPFPMLELTFTDLRGEVVATRRFPPPEYLHGELAGSDAMPTGTPVHIGLEIVDPGEQAVNYDLRLLSVPETPPRLGRAF